MVENTTDSFGASMAGRSLTDSQRKTLRRAPSGLWLLAALLLALSTQLPYWHMTLLAPQYPDGLSVRVFVNSMTGDDDPTLDEVTEIEGLNHYIGMKPLGEAAQFERSIAIPSVVVFLGLLVVAAIWRRKWVWLLTIPPLLFPFVYVGDLAYWLRNYGHNLDPSAPLSSAIKPFTPPVLGVGTVGQFSTVATFGLGWYLAAGGSLCILAAIIIHFRLLRQPVEDAAPSDG
jgi:hypothetical protein